MTLDEMARLICTELGVYDDTSLDLTKKFLNAEYKTIWDKYPWTDTEIYVTSRVLADEGSTPLYATINRVISVRATNVVQGAVDTPEFRSDARFLDPVTRKFLIETDPSVLERGGYTQYYEVITDLDLLTKIIRFYPATTAEMDVDVLGKANCPGLLVDADTSAIRNIDQALMAYATAWMLRRQRQYGKADVAYKRGQELEQVAWNLEQQQANLPRRTKATTVAGNSLAEMTDAVCTLCGQWTPEYRLVIRDFMRRNYQALYDLYLWPESLVTVLMTYRTEQLILPYYIDKVLGVRSPGNFRMTQMDGPLIFDLNPTVFDETGDPFSFTTLTPVGVNVLPAATSQLVLASTSTIDTSNVAIRGEVIATGQEYEEVVTLQGTTPVTTRYSYDIPLTFAKDITVGDVTMNADDGNFTALAQLLSYWREKKHQRLWLLPPLPDEPADGVVRPPRQLLVMGKRAIVPLVSDQDTPIITGAQQVLIAAAAGDLFRKLGQNDQANAMLQKAGASTDVLKAKNMDQAASSPRFVPQCEPRAYVGDYGDCWSK